MVPSLSHWDEAPRSNETLGAPQLLLPPQEKQEPFSLCPLRDVSLLFSQYHCEHSPLRGNWACRKTWGAYPPWLSQITGWGPGFSPLNRSLGPQDLHSHVRVQPRRWTPRLAIAGSDLVQMSTATEGGFCENPALCRRALPSTPNQGPVNTPHCLQDGSSEGLISGRWQPLAEEKPQHGTNSWLFLFPSQGCTLSFADTDLSPLQPRLARRSLSLQSGGETLPALFMQRSSLLTSPLPEFPTHVPLLFVAQTVWPPSALPSSDLTTWPWQPAEITPGLRHLFLAQIITCLTL